MPHCSTTLLRMTKQWQIGGPVLLWSLRGSLPGCCKDNLTVTVIGCAQRDCAIDYVYSASLRFFPSGSERDRNEEPAVVSPSLAGGKRRALTRVCQ